MFNRADCEDKVKNYKGARYRKFPTQREAEEFIEAYYADGRKLKRKYIPEGNAIAPPENLIQSNKKKDEEDDFWPPCDGDETQITDDELV